jgi:hypothetical protein
MSRETYVRASIESNMSCGRRRLGKERTRRRCSLSTPVMN